MASPSSRKRVDSSLRERWPLVVTAGIGLAVVALLGALWLYQGWPGFFKSGTELPSQPVSMAPLKGMTGTPKGHPGGPVRDYAFPLTPGGYRALILTSPPTGVHDGDTFDADLDGDGKVEIPRERVRLLFVDTPELGRSWKGRDRAHGLPARDYLKARLSKGPIRLLIPLERPTGKYGRTLALVDTPQGRVNLALVRNGHSPFDTRFNLPGDAENWVKAEGEAFDSRRGIWKKADSRESYLNRLKKEGRTPAGRTNPAYFPDILHASAFDPRSLLGRYVRLEGRLTRLEKRSKGVRIVHLGRGRGREPFPAVVFRSRRERLGVDRWKTGSPLRLEGFIQTYRESIQMRVNHGKVLK